MKPIKETIENLKDYQGRTHLKWSLIAKRIGISETALSQLKGETYQGNIEAMQEKIEQFLALEHKRTEKETLEVGYAETGQARSAMAVLRYCQTKRKMGIIVSEAGLGKTTVLKKYMEFNKNTLMITGYAGIVPIAFLDDILIKIGVEVPGQEAKKVSAIIERIEGSEKILLIDEAQHFKPGLFEKIRHIHDMTGCGIVISGNNTVVERMVGKETVFFDQLFSRIALRTKLNPKVSKADIEAWLKASNLDHLDKSHISLLTEVANKKGHYRLVYNVLEMGLEMAQEAGEELGIEHLRSAESVVFSVEI